MTAEYSESGESVEMTVRYNGEVFDPADSENELSYRVIKGISSGVRHEAVSEGDYTNLFRITIK